MNNIYTIILCFKLLLCNPSFSTVDEIVSIIDTQRNNNFENDHLLCTN